MTSTQASARLGGTIAAAGALATLGFLVLGGGQAAQSAFAGAVLAVANFRVWSWLVGRMLAKQLHSEASETGDGPPLGFLIVAKSALGFGVVAGLLALRLVEAVPFAAGLGSLVVGLVAGGMWVSTEVEPAPASSVLQENA